eukprot:gene2438-5378_t
MASASSHRQAVLRLYRYMLRDSRSWAIDYNLWMKHATELRSKFEANRYVDLRTAQNLLADAQRDYENNKHPDPYRPCTSLDGSKWERNLPPPAEPSSWNINLPK